MQRSLVDVHGTSLSRRYGTLRASVSLALEGVAMETIPEPVTTDWVQERLCVERDMLLAAVDRLADRATTAFVTEPDGWTAKDVLAHLIHYLGQIAFVLGASEKPPAYVVAESRRLSGQEWNDRAVEFWQAASLGEVRAEFVRLVDQVQAHAGTKTDEQMRSDHGLRWAPPGALWEFIGRDTFLHEWPAHRAQIELVCV
jgi:hypothetical protein